MKIKNLQKHLLEKSKKDVKQAITKEFLVIQAIRAYDETLNSEKRLKKIAKEWYSHEMPEAIHKHNFIGFIALKKEIVLERLKLDNSLGTTLSSKDKIPLQIFAKSLVEIARTNEELKTYIKHTMRLISPKFTELATPLIAARLLDKAGSIKQLANYPSSTIQMLGAEKAMFRHLRENTKSPKYGCIYTHPSVEKSRQKGKEARQLAGKLSIAIRMDYYANERN